MLNPRIVDQAIELPMFLCNGLNAVQYFIFIGGIEGLDS